MTEAILRAVWKYPLANPDSNGVVEVLMDPTAEPLCVQVQGGLPHVWVAANPRMPVWQRTTRRFRIIATGQEFDARRLLYVGTYQLLGGALVFHVFEVADA